MTLGRERSVSDALTRPIEDVTARLDSGSAVRKRKATWRAQPAAHLLGIRLASYLF